MKKLFNLLTTAFLAIILFMNVNVMGQVNPFFIDVLQPDRNNIDWVIGDSYLISWTDNLTQNFNILLWNPWIPDGIGGYAPDWEVLISNVPGTTWTWDMDDDYIAGNGYKIKVESTISPDAYKNEGKPFELIYALPNSIKVLQPNVNGIDWAWNTDHLISWEDNLDENIEIWLVNTDLGIEDELTPNNGVEGTTWVWEMDDSYPASTKYKIIVKSTDHPIVNDISNKFFTITETSGIINQIYQPNRTNIKWGETTTHLISWRDELNEPVDIFLSVSPPNPAAPGPWQIGDDVEGSTFEWNLATNPNPATFNWDDYGEDYLIIIKSCIDPDILKISKQFTVVPSSGNISRIYQPKNNTGWTVGTRHLISWWDNLDEKVDVYYTDGVGTILGTVDENVIGTTCYWDIPSNAPIGNNVVRIQVQGHDTPNIFKLSSAFNLTATSGTNITVIQPSVGGIKWALDTEHLISWEDDLWLETELVNIKLCKYANANDPEWPAISYVTIDTDREGSTYSWDIDPLLYDVGYYRICVISSDDNNVFDYSNRTFEITASSGTFVNIIQPSNGDDWMYNTEHLISWDDNCPENMYIWLYEYNSTGGDVANYSIETTGTGVEGSTYVWLIDQSITPTSYNNKFKIKVASVLDPTNLEDFSTGYFYIHPFGKSINLGNTNDVINIYPNPTGTQFTVSMAGIINRIEVRNLLGQLIYSSDVKVANTNIDVTNYDAGVYIVNILVEGEVITKKLFVQK